MKNNKINRRKLLKTTGAVSGFVFAGSVRATKTDYGAVRLVEVGVEYDLPERDDYQRTNVDGDPRYFVDPSQDRIVLTPSLPDHVERVFEVNDHVIGGIGVNSAPVSVTRSGPVRSITTDIGGGRRPTERIQLVDPHQPPSIRIQQGAGGKLTLDVENSRRTLKIGIDERFQLDTRSVTALTAKLTDRTADFDDIPEHRLGRITEYGEVDVQAVPTVSIKDYGEMSVVRIQSL